MDRPDTSTQRDSKVTEEAKPEGQVEQPTTEANAQLANSSYDVVPYPSHPFRQTHPDKLYTVAKLFGLEAAMPEKARVLEIGCASGGNIIPMADQLPDAEITGVELAKGQADVAVETVSRLGLENITVIQGDISTLDDELQEYDYIICHGVYSWVPPEIQDRILAVCQQNLAPNGVAFISYNTYPGWHFRGMIRDMMVFHDNEKMPPNDRVTQARALLTFLSESVNSESSAYGMMLKSELELLRKQADGYIFHEHLEAHNLPCYFHEFMDRATSKHLQYLGDSSISTMWIGNFPAKVAETLQRIAPDIIQREQYTDFVRNRPFRQSLLCHQNVQLNRTLNSSKLLDSYISGRFVPEDEQNNVDLNPNVTVSFQEPGTQRKISTSDPLTKAVLVHLSNAWPASLTFQDLFQTARLSIGSNQIEMSERVEKSRADLATQMLKLFVSGMVDVKYAPDRFSTAISQHPKVSAVARDQSTRDARLTNQRHEVIVVDDFIRQICHLTDGTRDREALIEYTRELVDQGKLVIHRNPDASNEDLMRLLTSAVDQALQKMAKQALLVS